jgi:hypothetical protein
MKMRLFKILILTTLLSSCATEVKYVPVQLELPPPIPQDMRLTHEELECVSAGTKKKIVLLDQRRITLEGIISGTSKAE